MKNNKVSYIDIEVIVIVSEPWDFVENMLEGKIIADNGEIKISTYDGPDSLDLRSSTNITDIMRQITNDKSEIYFNGCHTGQSAKWIGPTDSSLAMEVSKLLPGVKVRGNTGFVVGAHSFTIGDSVSYLRGKKQ